MGWMLRYASHLGYRSGPNLPLFCESVGSLDPLAHIAYAAELKLAGIQNAWAIERDAEQQRAMSRALDKYGLECGCVIYTTRDNVQKPLWARTGRQTRDDLRSALAAGLEAAKRHPHATFLF